MKIIALSAALVAAATTTAAAESADPPVVKPAPGYVGMGVSTGLESVAYLGFALDGGIRLGATPLFVHARVERGVAEQVFSDGTYQSYRAGLEARDCDRRNRLCWFGGVDAGVRAQQTDTELADRMEQLRDPLIVPRVGLELGSHIKFRVGLEAPVVIRKDETLVGPGLTVGIGYMF